MNVMKYVFVLSTNSIAAIIIITTVYLIKLTLTHAYWWEEKSLHSLATDMESDSYIML